MKVFMDEAYLNYFEALASPTRLQIIQLLSVQDRNIKELADILDISSSIVTKHVRKLESAHLITTRNISKNGSRHKQCTLLRMAVEVLPPDPHEAQRPAEPYFHFPLPVGLFTGLETAAPCGLATENKVLGYVDTPASLFALERVAAQLLWLSGGYVEYTCPNYLSERFTPTGIELSGEFGALPDQTGDPASVAVSLNGVPVCSFYALGDRGSGRWPFDVRGIRIVIRITKGGTFVNGEKKSAVSLEDFDYTASHWTLRLQCDGPEGSGLSLFGKKISTGKQDLTLRTFYQRWQ